MDRPVLSDRYVFHVHTRRCRHAQEIGDEAFIQKALEAGADSIWFTDHAPFPGDPFRHRMGYAELEDYLSSLTELKAGYKDRIAVHIGLETEYFPSYDEAGYYRQLKDDPRIELLLLGQHMAEDETGGYSFDWEKERLNEEEYTALGNAICRGIRSSYFSAVAHPDRSFRRRKTWTAEMAEIAEQIIMTAREYGLPLEQNETSKRHKHQYWEEFWQQAGDRVEILHGLDAHYLDEIYLV